MNVIDGSSLLAMLAFWLVSAIVAAVALTAVMRPKVAARYPGGRGRYVAALTIQAIGFILPIALVSLFLLGIVPPGFNFIAGFVAGFLVLVLLRYLPVTRPLLKDLDRARIEVAMERSPPYSRDPKTP